MFIGQLLVSGPIRVGYNFQNSTFGLFISAAIITLLRLVTPSGGNLERVHLPKIK